MPSFLQILGIIFLIAIFVIGIWYKRYQRSGKAGEKNTLRIIRNFLKDNHYQKQDYLLIHDLNFAKKSYWTCQIDILLLTRKWIYVIEVKDWQVGTLRGNFNDEYLELSWKIRRRRRLWRQRIYSPFFQNETHIKRLRSYFYLSEPNILSVVVFNSPNLGFNFKRGKNLVLKEQFTLTNFDAGRGIAEILAKYESQDTKLTSFEKVRKKIGKEFVALNTKESSKEILPKKNFKLGKSFKFPY